MIPPKRKSLNRPGQGPKDPPAKPASPPSKPSPAKPQLGPSNGARPGARPAPKPAGKATPPPAPHAAGPLRRGAPNPSARASASKAKMIGGLAGVGIVVIAALLFWLKSGQVDNEQLKKELTDKIAKALTKTDVIERYDALRDIKEKDEHKEYWIRKYTGAVADQLDKAIEDARPPAERQKKANADVPPFFEKFKGTDGLDQTKAQNLLDEAKHLRDDYAETTWGDKLKEAVKTLNDWLEAHKDTSSWQQEIMKLGYDVTQAIKDHDFKKAKQLIDDFGKKWKEDSDTELKGKLKEERDKVGRALHSFVGDTKKTAEEMIAKGEADHAKELLKKALESVRGLDGYDELNNVLKGIK